MAASHVAAIVRNLGRVKNAGVRIKEDLATSYVKLVPGKNPRRRLESKKVAFNLAGVALASVGARYRGNGFTLPIQRSQQTAARLRTPTKGARPHSRFATTSNT